ncbi:MAG: hypothetical protein F7C35_05610 [Desulfurococcales archaeon]|nr:hypothetical protein [Desulfurococcales archaeon]
MDGDRHAVGRILVESCTRPEGEVVGYARRIARGPIIVRTSRNRVEVLAPLGVKAVTTPPEGIYVRLVDEEIKGSIECFRRLLEGERYYEAHICGEAVMNQLDRRMGKCLAIYSALLLKIAEGLEGAVAYLRGLLGGCSSYVDLECVDSIIEGYRRRGWKVGGESVVCLLPL